MTMIGSSLSPPSRSSRLCQVHSRIQRFHFSRRFATVTTFCDPASAIPSGQSGNRRLGRAQLRLSSCLPFYLCQTRSSKLGYELRSSQLGELNTQTSGTDPSTAGGRHSTERRLRRLTRTTSRAQKTEAANTTTQHNGVLYTLTSAKTHHERQGSSNHTR